MQKTSSTSATVANNLNSIKAVWVLAGSAGATTAIQEFLNGFTCAPPVGFLYAQHFSVSGQKQLQQLTAENPIFSIDIGVGEHALVPGHVVMVPPQCKISIAPPGNVVSTYSSWGNQHTPNFNELFVILSNAGLPSIGVIIFSGMGNDGIDALPTVDAAGGHIWVQSPTTAICNSMPNAALETELVHRTASPTDLANALETLYSV